jgi:hypothetical protein
MCLVVCATQGVGCPTCYDVVDRDDGQFGCLYSLLCRTALSGTQERRGITRRGDASEHGRCKVRRVNSSPLSHCSIAAPAVPLHPPPPLSLPLPRDSQHATRNMPTATARSTPPRPFPSAPVRPPPSSLLPPPSSLRPPPSTFVAHTLDAHTLDAHRISSAWISSQPIRRSRRCPHGRCESGLCLSFPR